MSHILHKIITHEDFAAKMEIALDMAVRQKRLVVPDKMADEETVAVEHFRATSPFRFDEEAAKAGEDYLRFSVLGDASVRYRDIRDGQTEKTDNLPLQCNGYAQLTTPYFDPKTDTIEDAVERVAVVVPLKDLEIKTT